MKSTLQNFLRKVQNTNFEGIQNEVMNNFPNGCCKLSSLFLAKYLVINKVVEKEKILLSVKGQKKDLSHAWLEIEDQIIDITYEQFSNEKKYIFPLDSKFHSEFKGQTKLTYEEALSFSKDFEEVFNLNLKKLLTTEQADQPNSIHSLRSLAAIGYPGRYEIKKENFSKRSQTLKQVPIPL